VIELFQIATAELVRFLGSKLPDISSNWWQEHVVERLTLQQQRMVQERGYGTLEELDFAALLRVMDQNWYELSNALNLPRECRTWIKELQTVRNKWAHLSAEAMPESEIYRDADTLGRLLKAIGATPASLKAVESTKGAALAAMARSGRSSTSDAVLRQPLSVTAPTTNMGSGTTVPVGPAPMASLFKVGDVVVLRSDPNTHLPIIEVIAGGAECRYGVFHNNTKAFYYQSQLQALAVAAPERKVLSYPRTASTPDESPDSFIVRGQPVFAALRPGTVRALSISSRTKAHPR
jgi:hypothetical protein